MKKWTLRILVCLLLGAITTVAVARERQTTEEAPIEFHVRESPDVTLYVRESEYGSDALFVASRVRGGGLDDLGTLDEAQNALPEWTGLREPTADFRTGAVNSEIRWAASFGWPIRSMSFHGRAEIAPNGGPNGSDFQFEIEGGYEHDARMHPNSLHRAYPMIPLFPGFLISTFMFTAVWFALLFSVLIGFTTMRHVVRRQRGRCMRCGYDLRGEFDNGCSECGWNRGTEVAR